MYAGSFYGNRASKPPGWLRKGKIMKSLRSLGDRIVDAFVPKVDASALYYWRRSCVSFIVCTSGGRNYNTVLMEYVHDGSGTVTESYLAGCC